MIINKKSWHYQVYAFSYWGSTPLRTNLCQYMRRLIFVAPVMGIISAFMFVCFVVVITLGLVVMPIFGWLPTNWLVPWEILDGDGRYKYQGLKLGKSYRAFQVYPWHVILLALVGALEWWCYRCYGTHSLVLQGMTVGAIAAVLAVVFGLITYLSSDTGEVVNQYISAKKQRVCPIVEFESEE